MHAKPVIEQEKNNLMFGKDRCLYLYDCLFICTLDRCIYRDLIKQSSIFVLLGVLSSKGNLLDFYFTSLQLVLSVMWRPGYFEKRIPAEAGARVAGCVCCGGWGGGGRRERGWGSI